MPRIQDVGVPAGRFLRFRVEQAGSEEASGPVSFPETPWALEFNERTAQRTTKGDWESGMLQHQIPQEPRREPRGLRTAAPRVADLRGGQARIAPPHGRRAGERVGHDEPRGVSRRRRRPHLEHPGTEWPTLLQPGADKLCNLFGLVIRYQIQVEKENWTGEGRGSVAYKRCKVSTTINTTSASEFFTQDLEQQQSND